MQQRIRRFAVFFGAATLATSGLVMLACGTDNGTPVPTPQIEAGKDSSTGNNETGPTPTEEGGTVDGGGEGGVDCSNNPQLRDNSAAFRCAFKDASAPDASPTCANAESCCNTESKATGPGYCATGKNGSESLCIAQAPPGSTFNAGKGKVWECADKSACGAGELCCMIQDAARLAADPDNKLNIGNTPPTDMKHPAACKVQRVYNEGGSRCRQPATAGQCPTGEIKLCSLTDNNCLAGTTCTPFIDFTNFIDRGFCKAN